MDKLDKQILAYLKEEYESRLLSRENASAPEFHDLYSYLINDSDEQRSAEIIAYLQNNPEAQAFIRTARQLMEELSSAPEAKDIPAEWIRSAKNLSAPKKDISCPHCGKGISAFKKPLSSQKIANLCLLLLTISAFVLSFVFKRYFFQFLVLTLLFGFKWIIDQKNAKTQILVYKAITEGLHEEKAANSRFSKGFFTHK